MRKKSTFMALLSIVFGIIIILSPDILALLVGIYLILAGAAHLIE